MNYDEHNQQNDVSEVMSDEVIHDTTACSSSSLPNM